MELATPHVATAHDARETPRVVRARQHIGAIGVVGHALLAHIVWAPAVAVGCGAIVGAQLGARLARKSKPRLIVILLSCVMVALGCQLVWRGFSL